MFYINHSIFDKDFVFLEHTELQHAIKVLKYKKNQQATLSDGKGNIFQGIVTDISRKHCKIQITGQQNTPPPTHHIHIGICPTKNTDRIEWFIEKATELGIQEISFILSTYSERKEIKLERIEKKAIASMKQSLGVYLPKINPLVSFQNFITEDLRKNEQKFVAHQVVSHTHSLYKVASPKQSYCVLVGPEGGFSEEEVKEAKKYHFDAVSLGTSRLRTETAGIAACHILNLIQH